MSIDQQIALCESLSDRVIGLWTKLGGVYAEWSDSKIHQILFNKHKTAVLRESFNEYPQTELTRSAGVLFRMVAAYQRKWNETWKAEAAQREATQQQRDAAQQQRDSVISECMSRDAVMEWMAENAGGVSPVQYFTWQATIDGVHYYRRREKPIRLFSEAAARTLHEPLRDSIEFQSMFDLVAEPGLGKPMFRPLVTITTHVAPR